MNISVVIATLGTDVIHETLLKINSGTVVPDEIIICIPEDLVQNFSRYKFPYDNVKILFTKIRGQVGQRAIGFMHSSNELVLQLDDDIHIERFTIENLTAKLIKLGPGFAIAPVLCDKITRDSLYRNSLGYRSILNNIFHSCIGGLPFGLSKMGAYSELTCSCSVDPSFYTSDVSVNWLPGGCILNYKQDLILYDFYPCTGKAYAEDLLHSHLRGIKNIKHILSINDKVFTTCSFSYGNSIQNLLKEIKSRWCVGLSMGASKYRLSFFLITLLIINIIKIGKKKLSL